MITHDASTRAAMDAACQRVAEIMLEVGNWRDRWRVEIDGCVFKVDIKGYPKSGTERYRKRQEEIEQAVAEFEAGENATVSSGDGAS